MLIRTFQMLVEVKETVKEMKSFLENFKITNMTEKIENDSLNTTPLQPFKKFKKLFDHHINMMLKSDENSRKQLVIIQNKYLFQSNGL
jgi:hypothetical protein